MTFIHKSPIAVLKQETSGERKKGREIRKGERREGNRGRRGGGEGRRFKEERNGRKVGRKG